MPKDLCLKDCQVLQAIQEIQITIKQDVMPPAIDYTEEGRFTINSKEVA